jgi:hypothetical protein
MVYTPHAQIAREERLIGRLVQPNPEELRLIEVYRTNYHAAFGVEPVGTHWLDSLGCMVLLRRAGGLPGQEATDGG